jgi:hypothetical protein
VFGGGEKEGVSVFFRAPWWRQRRARRGSRFCAPKEGARAASRSLARRGRKNNLREKSPTPSIIFATQKSAFGGYGFLSVCLCACVLVSSLSGGFGGSERGAGALAALSSARKKKKKKKKKKKNTKKKKKKKQKTPNPNN